MAINVTGAYIAIFMLAFVGILFWNLADKDNPDSSHKKPPKSH